MSSSRLGRTNHLVDSCFKDIPYDPMESLEKVEENTSHPQPIGSGLKYQKFVSDLKKTLS